VTASFISRREWTNGVASRPPATASLFPDSGTRNLAESARCALAGGVQSPGVTEATRQPGPDGTQPLVEENAMNRKSYTLIGAGIGLALFLILALLPSLLYGGYAGVLLASGIVGTPVKATLLVRALIIFGMVLGVVGVGALFAVGGAVGGAVVSVLAGARPEHEAKPAKSAS
jgi:hypothetical protein